ncbi:MAG TPA: DNA repair protein RecN, partial [Allosphingosinicella sp.]
PEALPALAEELAERLAGIEAGDAGLAAMEKALRTSRLAYDEEAARLSLLRAEAGARLDLAVARELAPLKLDAARFRTIVEAQNEAQWSAAGRDRVEFEVSTNPGAAFAPLTRIASGGELSRFILALKVALAERGGATTMIFDEIDRGVGGAVASAVGERLHRLAAEAQVLVVTHSPQVAARGSRHLLIEKSHEGLVTRTSVHALDEAKRREEIARMLSGAQVTDEARAQASRLLEAA